MSACIERKLLGATEFIDFTEFAEMVVQDESVARWIAQQMLDGADPYKYNEDQAEFYEEFSVVDADALRAQLEANT